MDKKTVAENNRVPIGIYHIEFEELSVTETAEVFREGRLQINVDSDTLHLRLIDAEGKDLIIAQAKNAYTRLIMPETQFALIGEYQIVGGRHKNLFGRYIEKVTGCRVITEQIITEKIEKDLTYARGVETGLQLAEKRAELFKRGDALYQEIRALKREREQTRKTLAQIDAEIDMHMQALNPDAARAAPDATAGVSEPIADVDPTETEKLFGTYAEKWERMSEADRKAVSEEVGVALTALIDQKDNIRLCDEFKGWAADAILQAITKNHFTIEYYKKFCEKQGICLFKGLEICLENYKAAITKEKERDVKRDVE